MCGNRKESSDFFMKNYAFLRRPPFSPITAIADSLSIAIIPPGHANWFGPCGAAELNSGICDAGNHLVSCRLAVRPGRFCPGTGVAAAYSVAGPQTV